MVIGFLGCGDLRFRSRVGGFEKKSAKRMGWCSVLFSWWFELFGGWMLERGVRSLLACKVETETWWLSAEAGRDRWDVSTLQLPPSYPGQCQVHSPGFDSAYVLNC